jgi:predicted RNA-binding protein with TRAM domain
VGPYCGYFQCWVDNSVPLLLFLIDLDSFGLKRARSYEKYDKKGNHFGGLKSPKTPISVGEEYILTIEEMGKEGSGIAKFRGVSIFVNNTSPGEKVMVRITKVGRSYAAAEVFTQNVTGY